MRSPLGEKSKPLPTDGWADRRTDGRTDVVTYKVACKRPENIIVMQKQNKLMEKQNADVLRKAILNEYWRTGKKANK